MAATYTTLGRAVQQEYNTNDDSWGTELNIGALEVLDSMWGRGAAITVSGNVTLTIANGVADQSRHFVLEFTGAGGFTVTAPANVKTYLIVNNCSANVTVKPAGGTGAVVRAGTIALYYTNAAATVGYAVDPTLDKIKTAAADVSIGGYKLTNVADPTSAQHAATKNYIDTLASSSNLGIVAGLADEIVTVAGIAANVTSVANDSANIGVVASNIIDVVTCSNNIAAIIDAAALVAGATALVLSQRTSNVQIVASDKGDLIDITSGTFSQTFVAAATLQSGWWCYYMNSGTGTVTLDPNASETINGAATLNVSPGQCYLIQCNGTSFKAVLVAGDAVMVVVEEYAAGGAPANGTASWNIRTLNTVRSNTISGASLSSNQITLPAGTYEISANAAAYNCGNHKTRLYDVTNSVVINYGSAEYLPTATSVGNRSFVKTVYSSSSSFSFRVDHRYQTSSGSGYSLGNPTAWNGENEVYTEVHVRKLR